MAKRQKWKDKLRPAKFRGLAFFIDTSGFETGRRGHSHEFPGRDIPYREDLGRRAKSWPVEGYVLGPDYLTAKNKLVAACEKEGPGELLHPYWGKLNVNVDLLSVQETSGEGGYCKLSFKFVEAGSLKFPTSLIDTGFGVLGAAGALADSAIASFTDTVSIIGQATDFVTLAADKVSDFGDLVTATTSGITGAAADIANLAFAIRDLKANARDLLGTPALLAAQMNSSLDLLVKACSTKDLLEAAKKMFTFGDDDPSVASTTTARAQLGANLGGLNTLVQVLAVSKGAVAATDVDYSSVQDATASRDVLTAHVDKLSLANGEAATPDDETYNSLQNLRSQIVKSIPAPGQDLAQIAEYTPAVTLPILAIVYDQYGSLDLEDDVITRNNIMNPGFAPGGIPLEVLDRGTG